MKDIPVLFENSDILIVNKPQAIAVQGGQGISVCLIDILERQFSSKLFPVHRLDKETSGLLIVARNQAAAAEYSNHIASQSLSKKYRAVCFGTPQKIEGVIQSPAGRSGNEKNADTYYQVEASNERASLVSLELGTGRMHQIRIHLASIGCPIIADDKYGDFKKNREIRSTLHIRKLQLCAYALTVPIKKKNTFFSIPLPIHMKECLSLLELSCSELLT